MKVGGLGICNLKLKCQALLLSLVISTISNPDDSSFFSLQILYWPPSVMNAC